jgi:hypothetical protein
LYIVVFLYAVVPGALVEEAAPTHSHTSLERISARLAGGPETHRTSKLDCFLELPLHIALFGPKARESPGIQAY